MFFVKFISAVIESMRRTNTVNGRSRYDPRTGVDVAPFGIDSAPPEGWTAVYLPSECDDAQAVVGYVNEKAIMETGNTRLYSSGDLDIRVLADSTIEIGGNTKNLVRFQELETGFNQLRSDLNTLITTYNTHTHPVVVAGSPGVASATTATGTPSSASISAAKIEEIKTL